MEKFNELINVMMNMAGKILDITAEDITFEIRSLPPRAAAAFISIPFNRGLLLVNTTALDETYNLPLHHIIAHEMIHAKQWLDGRLTHAYDIKTHKPVVYWERVLYYNPDMFDTDSPWEKEAYNNMAALGDLMIDAARETIAEMSQVA